MVYYKNTPMASVAHFIVIVPLFNQSQPVHAPSYLGSAAANPIASMISVPFESSWDFGADNYTVYV